MRETFHASQWVSFPVELVFAFFANPGNFPHLMPKWQQARIESSRLIAPPPRPIATDPALRYQSPAAGVGSEMMVSFRPIARVPFRTRWLARITEFAWNSHFCDEQLKGPFVSWTHLHGIVSEARDGLPGTSITDQVEYTLPFGALGSMANALFVRRRLESTFAYRRERLEAILPVALKQASRRN